MADRIIKYRLRVENKVVGYEKWYGGAWNSPSRKDYRMADPKWLYSKDEGKTWNPEYIFHDDKDSFTGLKDKNGKEIYESDRLKNLAGDVGTVEFDDGCFIIRHKNGTSDFIAGKNHFEVIGNIYES